MEVPQWRERVTKKAKNLGGKGPAPRLPEYWWKCFRSLQLAIVAPSSIPDVATLGEMDRSCTPGGCQHVDLHVDASFGHLLLCQGAFYDLKRRCLATKNHPIWLILH